MKPKPDEEVTCVASRTRGMAGKIMHECRFCQKAAATSNMCASCLTAYVAAEVDLVRFLQREEENYKDNSGGFTVRHLAKLIADGWLRK
jgi:hypothetical protein